VLRSLEFSVGTSLSAITVHGKADPAAGGASGFQGEAVFGSAGLGSLRVVMPVELLTTGMSLRDRHMKDLVFRDAGGGLPPLKLASQRIECREGRCRISGLLSIRGIERLADFECALEGGTGGAPVSSSSCSAVIKLSSYQIEPPAQLGVKVQDEVTLKLRVGLP
jgi:polyisoprenoid-binding protein YceI